MAREYQRSHRVADFLKRELATVIQKEIRDPRIGMVSVNDVRVSRDASHAKVYVTFLDEALESKAKESIDVLNRAAGFLRSHIANSSSMRAIPKLVFYFDASVERGHRISKLITQAIIADKNADKQADTNTDEKADKAEQDQVIPNSDNGVDDGGS